MSQMTHWRPLTSANFKRGTSENARVRRPAPGIEPFGLPLPPFPPGSPPADLGIESSRPNDLYALFLGKSGSLARSSQRRGGSAYSSLLSQRKSRSRLV